MPTLLTRKQRAQNVNAIKKKKYQDDKRRGTLTSKKLWQFAFIGSVPIEKLYKCYNIKP